METVVSLDDWDGKVPDGKVKAIVYEASPNSYRVVSPDVYKVVNGLIQFSGHQPQTTNSSGCISVTVEDAVDAQQPVAEGSAE